MRTSIIYGMLFATSMSLAVGACTSQDDGSLEPGETEDVGTDGKADGSTTLGVGDYSISPDYSLYWELDLSAGSAYTLRGGCKPNPTGPSCFAIVLDSGHYKLTKSGTKKYVRLYSDETACTTCSGSDEFLVRFQYTLTSTGANVVDTSDNDKYTLTLPVATASSVLTADLGAKTLTCADSGGDPKSFAISVSAGTIAATATDSRGANYSVDSSKITSGNNLELFVSNDVDGPLAQDILTFPVTSLATLATGSTTVNGHDYYSEQYDGTSSTYTLKCKL